MKLNEVSRSYPETADEIADKIFDYYTELATQASEEEEAPLDVVYKYLQRFIEVAEENHAPAALEMLGFWDLSSTELSNVTHFLRYKAKGIRRLLVSQRRRSE